MFGIDGGVHEVPNEVIFGCEKTFRCVDGVNAAVVHEGDAVGHGHGEAAVVGDDDAGNVDFFFQRGDDFRNGGRHDWVELGRGFVVEQELRLHDKCPGNGYPLAHAARELRRVFVGGVFEREHRQRVHDFCANVGVAIQPVFLGIEGEVIKDVKRVQQRARLENEPHNDFALRFVDVEAVDQNLALIWPIEANDVFEQNALSGAARPHQYKDFARGNVERNVVEDLLLTKRFIDIFYFYTDGVFFHLNKDLGYKVVQQENKYH